MKSIGDSRPLDYEDALVSIIVPCFNSERFLEQTLSNVGQQSYKNWECIIINDGSTDSTSTICNSFVNQDTRFHLFTQTNRGLPASRNAGLRKSKGQYIQFLDSDDFLHSKKIETQIKLLKENPDTDIIYGPCKFFSSEEPGVLYDRYDLKNGRWMKVISSNDRLRSIEIMITSNVMPVNAALYRIRTNRQFRLFDESLRSLEDWDYWLGLLFDGAVFQFDADPNTVSYIRVHTTSMTRNSFQMASANHLIRERLNLKLLELKLFSEAERKKLISLNKYFIGRIMVRNFDIQHGLQLIFINAHSAQGGFLNLLKGLSDLFYRLKSSFKF